MYNSDLMNIKELTRAMHQFVSEKGWYEPDSLRPQTPRNLAASLSIEAAEVLECFQWSEDLPDQNLLAGELADVMLYLLQLASICEIDLESVVIQKLQLNYRRSWDKEQQEKKVEK
jgi:NTP pyrophosphatase (non-canonical NTP hydrolase)